MQDVHSRIHVAVYLEQRCLWSSGGESWEMLVGGGRAGSSTSSALYATPHLHVEMVCAIACVGVVLLFWRRRAEFGVANHLI